MAAEPALTRLALVDTVRARGSMLDLRSPGGSSSPGSLAAVYAREAGGAVDAGLAAEVVMGGLHWLPTRWVADGRVARLPELAPFIGVWGLTPVLGAAEAVAVVSATGERR